MATPAAHAAHAGTSATTQPSRSAGARAPQRPAARPPVLNPEHVKTSLDEIKARRGPAPWNEILIRNDRLTATVICQPPGHQNDHHYHIYDEWWYIAEGELAWELEGQPEPIYVKAGDFVLAPANCYHLIHVLGDKQAIRIGFSYTGEGHRHDRRDPPPPAVRGHGNL